MRRDEAAFPKIYGHFPNIYGKKNICSFLLFVLIPGSKQSLFSPLLPLVLQTVTDNSWLLMGSPVAKTDGNQISNLQKAR
jgi:hypothetical protein